MKHWFSTARRWSLAILSVTTLGVGAFALWSCGGEGGPVGSGGGGGGGGTNSGFLALLPPGQAGATYVGPDTCKTCHNAAPASAQKGHAITASLTTKPAAVYDEWHDTTHFKKGVTCENCHGPGSKHAAAPSKDTILTFPNSTSPIVCGQCHGPIADTWAKSGHANLIPDPVDETITATANFKGARCVVCHSGLIRTKVEEGTDLGTISDADLVTLSQQTLDKVPHIASCVTCHDPHAKTGNLSDEGEEKQIRHPLSSTDTSAIGPGTTPDKFTMFNHQCAECHNGRGANGGDAKLQSSTARPNMHDSNQYNMLTGVGGSEGSGITTRTTAHLNVDGQCVHCHMPSESHSFKTSYDKSCQPCHSTDDAAARAATLKTEVTNALFAIKARLGTWAKGALGNEILWDYTSLLPTGTTPPDQTLVPIEIKRARHNYYFIIRDASMGIHNAVYTRQLIKIANQNLDSLGVAPAPSSLNQIPTNVKVDALLKAGRVSKAEASRLD